MQEKESDNMMDDDYPSDDFNEGLCENPEVRVEDQDLRILKAILCDSTIARDFAGNYDSTVFMGAAKEFAAIVIDYIKAYKSFPTKRIMLDKAGQDDGLANVVETIWDELEHTEYNPVEFQYDLDKLKERHTRNRIYSIKRGLADFDFEGGNFTNTLHRIKSEINAAENVSAGGNGQSYTQKTLKAYMPEFREDFASKVKNPDLGRGILTKYSYLDYVTNGIRPSQMMIICGETSAGKSMFLNNMAIQMWMQGNKLDTPTESFEKGYNILYFSLEMPYDACARRTMCRLADLPIYGLRDCKLNTDQVTRLGDAAKFIDRYPFDFEIVDIPRGVTIGHIEECYQNAVMNGRRPDVVVVDYLGLMESTEPTADDWLKLGNIAGKLHEFARAYNTIVLTAEQLRRPPDKKNAESYELVGMHRIGRSWIIVHHADLVLQIESRKDEKTYPDLIYHIIKCRDGELGNHILSKKFKSATLVDLKPYEPEEEEENISGFSSPEDLSSFLDQIGFYGEKNE